MEINAILLSAALLLLGLGVGWFLGNRPLRTARADIDQARQERDAARAETEGWREKFNAAIRDLAVASDTVGRVEKLDGELRDERRTSSDLAAKVAAFERGEAERHRAHEAQLAQLNELAGKVVEGAHELFLKRADERLGHADKRSEEKLKALLQPVEATLKRYEEGLGRVEKEREGSYRELNKAVELLHAGHTQVRDETARLVNALRSSPKARGRWGEQSLKNVLEQAGLSPYADFLSEVSVTTEDGRLRPDVIVRLPGGRKLIIDAKCSLNAFLDASGEIDETTRLGHMKAHVASIRRHAEQLGSKAYWQQFGDAADYVVMYIPGEHFLTAALEQDAMLWEWAFERRVLLATPTNLVAIARTVASVWRQEKIAEEAQKVDDLAKLLYERLCVAADHLKVMGGALGSAVRHYNKFVSSFETRVLVTGREFKALNVETGKREIERLPAIETLPKYDNGAVSDDVEEVRVVESRG